MKKMAMVVLMVLVAGMSWGQATGKAELLKDKDGNTVGGKAQGQLKTEERVFNGLLGRDSKYEGSAELSKEKGLIIQGKTEKTLALFDKLGIGSGKKDEVLIGGKREVEVNVVAGGNHINTGSNPLIGGLGPVKINENGAGVDGGVYAEVKAKDRLFSESLPGKPQVYAFSEAFAGAKAKGGLLKDKDGTWFLGVDAKVGADVSAGIGASYSPTDVFSKLPIWMQLTDPAGVAYLLGLDSNVDVKVGVGAGAAGGFNGYFKWDPEKEKISFTLGGELDAELGLSGEGELSLGYTRLLDNIKDKTGVDVRAAAKDIAEAGQRAVDTLKQQHGDSKIVGGILDLIGSLLGSANAQSGSGGGQTQTPLPGGNSGTSTGNAGKNPGTAGGSTGGGSSGGGDGGKKGGATTFGSWW